MHVARIFEVEISRKKITRYKKLMLTLPYEESLYSTPPLAAKTFHFLASFSLTKTTNKNPEE